MESYIEHLRVFMPLRQHVYVINVHIPKFLSAHEECNRVAC